MAGDDMGERTEKPTPRRLSKARNRGQVAKSQDLAAAIALASAVVLMLTLGGSLMRTLATIMTRVLSGQTPGGFLEVTGALGAARFAGTSAMLALLPFLLLTFLVAYLANFLQIGWLFTFEPVKPKFSKFNPVSGIQRLFSLRNLVKSGVNFLKLIVVALVSWISIARSLPQIVSLPRLGAIQAMLTIGRLALELALLLVLILLVLAIIDFIYQKWQHIKDLKMTKHEVKDERRSMEGDPQVKKRRFEMAVEIATQRIRKQVPGADVVISNPTHFAVALKYDGESMRAPVLVAKGADLMALRIRQVASLHGVPIVERPPLARAIYWGVEEGREIPPHLYEAVAEVLAYVYRMNQTQAA